MEYLVLKNNNNKITYNLRFLKINLLGDFDSLEFVIPQVRLVFWFCGNLCGTGTSFIICPWTDQLTRLCSCFISKTQPDVFLYFLKSTETSMWSYCLILLYSIFAKLTNPSIWEFFSIIWKLLQVKEEKWYYDIMYWFHLDNSMSESEVTL